MTKAIEAADLFCGAGGTSEGMMRASKDLGISLNLLAVNHWPVAISSHSLNHPTVRHKCESLDAIKPREQVPGGRLHMLAASPECTHHSLAAGGKPKNDQSRATAWHICRWASDLTIDNIFIENVAEFQSWGPLDSKGKPIKSRKGETFQAFINALESMNYRVEHRVQNAADFGDPTSRRRLIILARRNGKPIRWPDPSHGMFRKPHRTAREIIDWDLNGKSIFNRKRPLSKNTLRRIESGLRKFCGEQAAPFLIKLRGTSTTAPVDLPLPTLTAGGNHLGLVQPFLVGVTHSRHDGNAHSINKPVPTLTTAKGGEYALVQPFLTKYYGAGAGCTSIDEPTPTITTRDRFALVEPQPDGVDILLRMLQPHELQAAMSFPKDYRFYGNRQQVVKQIGNAVPVELARAHTAALLAEHSTAA